MQSYSHPDLFFCPLYNRPGISDPKMNLCGSDLEDEESFWTSGTPCSSSPTSPSSSTNSSRSSSLGPSSSSSSSSETTRDRKLHKFKCMSAEAGKSLLDFATEADSQRIVDKRQQRQLQVSQISRNAPQQP